MVFALVSGCAFSPAGIDSDSADLDRSSNYVAAGTPDAVAVLALVNDPATTLSILDDAVRLDSRAAANISAHRLGLDGLAGTADDGLFASIAELDAIPYVGVSALTRLLDYANAHGYGAGEPTPPQPREALILAVANDATLDFATLDDDVGLDRRAASGIVDRRPFASIEALDAVPYVGDSALARLHAYAVANDYGAPDTGAPRRCGGRSRVDCGANAFCDYPIASYCGRGDRGGTCRPIPEACSADYAPVCGCNGLSFSNACLAAAAGVSVVREGACLAGLGGRCNDATACGADLVCEGIAGEGSERYGFCRPAASVPGYWETCTSEGECNDGLSCFGLALGASEGWCGDDWARRTFYSSSEVAIPDDDGAGASATSTIIARGLATAEMDVVITLRVQHTYRGDLRIVLTSPVGEEAVVFEGRPDDSAADVALDRLALPFPGDGSANGAWTLRLTDRAAEDVGVLTSWSLEVSSRWD